jgi:MFS family permease
MANGANDMATPKGAWTMASLLFVYMMINFADKAVVGLAAVPIMRELDLTPKQYGTLGSGFFLLFSLSGILVGFQANRRPTRWIILLLAASWSLAQFPMIGAVSFTTLLVCRVLLGAGEGPAAAVALHAVYKWFPDEKRTMPTAFLSQGAAIGVIVALPVLNWIILRYSWHWAFGTLGLAGLIWVAVWYFAGLDGPIHDGPLREAPIKNLPLQPTETERPEFPPAERPGYVQPERVGYAQLMLAPTFVGCVLACFGAYWSLAMGLTWFTPFVVKGLGVPQSSAGWIASLPWVMGACTVLLSGWISQVLVGRGVSTRVARGVLGAGPLIVGGAFIGCLPLVSGAAAKIALLVIGTGLSGPIYVVCAPMIAEFTPTLQRGAAIASFGAIYTLAGVIAPYANGSVIERAATALEGYQTGYLICAAMQVAGGLCGLALMWPAQDRARMTRHRMATAAATDVRFG